MIILNDMDITANCLRGGTRTSTSATSLISKNRVTTSYGLIRHFRPPLLHLDRVRRDLDSTWTLAMGHETAFRDVAILQIIST